MLCILFTWHRPPSHDEEYQRKRLSSTIAVILVDTTIQAWPFESKRSCSIDEVIITTTSSAVSYYETVCTVTTQFSVYDNIFSRLNILRPRQNRRHFADDIFKCIFLNENVWISINISLKFVRKGLIDHIPALVQLMAWCRPGDKPLSEPMMISLPTRICVTRPRWVK